MDGSGLKYKRCCRP
ncbi:MAG: SEC-C domain-containing protein [Nitrospinae bacterium]|nr:SEC-C domain-containing protein [Nitrospinota bacterium]